jgi:hypothetical protein
VPEIYRYFRVPLGEIAFVRAVIEAHEGLAQVSSLGSDRGEIEVVFARGRDAEVERVLARLASATGWVEIARPADRDAVDHVRSRAGA